MNQYLTLFNRFDEQNRFVGFYFTESTHQQQQDSHGFSYLQLRRYNKELNSVWLHTLIQEGELEKILINGNSTDNNRQEDRRYVCNNAV